ncbi:hypothetical protein SR89_18325 [Klebsiella aerogenes]|nr:hypothetical protein SR89_18325 [Klebsiella aerogenes]
MQLQSIFLNPVAKAAGYIFMQMSHFVASLPLGPLSLTQIAEFTCSEDQIKSRLTKIEEQGNYSDLFAEVKAAISRNRF